MANALLGAPGARPGQLRFSASLLRAGAAKQSRERQPTAALIAVGGYLKPILQISALDTNISNFKKVERKESEEIKTPSFTFLRNMKLCF